MPNIVRDVIASPYASAIARAFRRLSGGRTVAANDTVGVAFEFENSTGGIKRLASLEAVATTVTAGSEAADLVLKLSTAGGAPSTVRTWKSDGTSTDLNGNAAAAWIVRDYTFTETDGADATYTATCIVPAGYTVVDIKFGSTVVWNAATSASLVIGDADSSTGYYGSTNVKSSPAANTAGGYGLDLETAAGTYRNGKYYATAGLITATVTTDDDGTHHGGRSRMQVIMVKGETAVAATKA